MISLPGQHPWCREDLKLAGLANVTATLLNLLGLEAPDFYQPSLVTTD